MHIHVICTIVIKNKFILYGTNLNKSERGRDAKFFEKKTKVLHHFNVKQKSIIIKLLN